MAVWVAAATRKERESPGQDARGFHGMNSGEGVRMGHAIMGRGVNFVGFGRSCWP